MKIELSNPPRIFHIPLPNGERITLSDCAHITLGVDEQITLFTDNGNEYDITRKDWGYYATPSLNRRLAHFHLRAVLVRGLNDTFFINLVEQGHEENFQQYLDYHNIRVVAWLDTLEALEHLEALMLSNQYSPQLEITRFAQAHLAGDTRTLLEVQSQHAELGASLEQRGWTVSHLQNVDTPTPEQPYDVVCFNQVLRNDDESRHLLKEAHRFLRQGGFVFVAVSTDTPHAFSVGTLALMAELTEWEIIRIERQQNILFAFLVHKES